MDRSGDGMNAERRPAPRLRSHGLAAETTSQIFATLLRKHHAWNAGARERVSAEMKYRSKADLAARSARFRAAGTAISPQCPKLAWILFQKGILNCKSLKALPVLQILAVKD